MLVSMLLFLVMCLVCVVFFKIYIAQCFSTWITSLRCVLHHIVTVLRHVFCTSLYL
jgi:hypothetical protein